MNKNVRNSGRQRKRRIVSCLLCREHKLKCDHGTPCEACTRYGQVDRCQQYPSPSIHGLIKQPAGSCLPRSASSYEQISLQKDSRLGKAVNGPFGLIEADSSRRSHHLSFMKLVPKSSREKLTSAQIHLSFLPRAFGIPDIAKLRRLPVSEIADGSVSRSHLPNNQTDYWKVLLSRTLPKRPFCDVLLQFFFEILTGFTVRSTSHHS
jgi:hypothetical protein